MVKLTSEAKVGLLVFAGIILLAYMSLRVGGMSFGRDDGYRLTVKLESAAGLDKDASVRVAGVEVGRVKDIDLEDNKAKLTLLIRPKVKIGKDFTAALRTKGLLGEKYLELIPGSPNAPHLEEGEEITRVTTYTDMEKLVTVLTDLAHDLKDVTASLSAALGGKEGETTVKNIVRNIEELTMHVNKLVKDDKLRDIVDNFDEFSRSLKLLSNDLQIVLKENRGNLKEGIENLKTASESLKETMETINTLAPRISKTVDSIDNITGKIDRGEGTLGKLVNDTETHDNLNSTLSGLNRYISKTEGFRMYLGYRGDYLIEPEDVKSVFSLKVRPKKDKFYLFEVVDDPRGDVSIEEVTRIVDGVTTTVEETTTTDELKFSAQIAKRFWDLTLRGGLIENTGGVGFDYHIFSDRIKFYFDAYDFSSENRAHLRAGINVHLAKYFYLTGGYDDFNSKADLDSAFVGIGFVFEDDDIKYLLSGAPPVSF